MHACEFSGQLHSGWEWGTGTALGLPSAGQQRESATLQVSNYQETLTYDGVQVRLDSLLAVELQIVLQLLQPLQAQGKQRGGGGGANKGGTDTQRVGRRHAVASWLAARLVLHAGCQCAPQCTAETGLATG